MTPTANEIEIIVTGTNKSGPAFRGAQDDLDKLKTKAKATGVDLDGLSNEFAALSEHAETFGEKIKGSANFSEFLETKLTALRTETERLAEDFNRTGNTDLLGKMFSSKGAEDALGKLKTGLDDVLKRAGKDAEDALTTGGKEGAKNVSASMQGALDTPVLGPIVATALAAGAVAAAPAIGAALAGAASLGGIAGIVVGQMGDPKVHSAITGIGTDLMSALTSSTKGFQEPLIAAAGQIGKALTGFTQGIDWKSVAAGIAPLADGLSRLAQSILPGFNELLKASSPIMHSLDQDLATLGKDLSTAFHLLASGSKGEAEALRALVMVVGGLAIALASLIYGVSKLVEWFTAAADKVGSFMASIRTGIPGLDYLLRAVNNIGSGLEHMAHMFNGADDSVRSASHAIGEAAQKASSASANLDALSKAADNVGQSMATVAAKWVDKLFSEMMNADEATLHWHESLNTLSDTLKQNGLAIDRHTHLVDINSEAGLKNREAILAAVQANEQQYQAMVASGISAQDAASAYDQNTEALKRQLKNAGYTSAQIEDLIGKYERVPDKVDTALAVQGLTEALDNLGNLLAEINHLNGATFGFTVKANVYGPDGQGTTRQRFAHGGITGAATGGIRDGLTMVGEYGRELVDLAPGSRVIPHGTTENMMAGARGKDGPLVIEMRFTGTGSRVQDFKHDVRTGQIVLTDSSGMPITVR